MSVKSVKTQNNTWDNNLVHNADKVPTLCTRMKKEQK